MQISSLFGAQAPVETRPSLADEGLIKYDQGKEVAYNWILGQVQNPQEREGKLEQFFNHGRLGVYKTGPKPAEFLAFLLNGIDQKTFEGAQAESINFCLNKLEKETFQKAYAKQHDRCPEFKLTAEQQRFLGISVEGSDVVDSEDSASTVEIPFAGTRRDQVPLDIIVPKIDIHQIAANRGGSGEQSEGSDSAASSSDSLIQNGANGLHSENQGEENPSMMISLEALRALGERRPIDAFSRSPSPSQVSNQLKENQATKPSDETRRRLFQLLEKEPRTIIDDMNVEVFSSQLIEQLEKEAEGASDSESAPSEAGFFTYMYGSEDPEQRTSFQKMNRFLAFEHGFDSPLGQVIAIISAIVLDILCVATAGILYGVMALACHSHDRGMQAAEELNTEVDREQEVPSLEQQQQKVDTNTVELESLVDSSTDASEAL